MFKELSKDRSQSESDANVKNNESPLIDPSFIDLYSIFVSVKGSFIKLIVWKLMHPQRHHQKSRIMQEHVIRDSTTNSGVTNRISRRMKI